DINAPAVSSDSGAEAALHYAKVTKAANETHGDRLLQDEIGAIGREYWNVKAVAEAVAERDPAGLRCISAMAEEPDTARFRAWLVHPWTPTSSKLTKFAGRWRFLCPSGVRQCTVFGGCYIVFGAA